MKIINSFEDNIKELEANSNYMSDILFLPTAKYGFNIDTVIIEMNKIRKRELPDKNEFDTRFVNDIREVWKISFNKKLVRRLKLLKKNLLDLNSELDN